MISQKFSTFSSSAASALSCLHHMILSVHFALVSINNVIVFVLSLVYGMTCDLYYALILSHRACLKTIDTFCDIRCAGVLEQNVHYNHRAIYTYTLYIHYKFMMTEPYNTCRQILLTCGVSDVAKCV